MKNLNFLLFGFLGILVFVISSYLYVTHKKQEMFQSSVLEKISENKKSLDYVSSGMSLDEKRLRNIMQVEKIIEDHNKKYSWKLKSEFIHSLAMMIVDVCSKYPNLNPILFCSLISVESKFNPRALSPVFAKGLTQIMNGTSEEICFRFGWGYSDTITFNAEKNILMGAYYFSKLIDRNNGSVERALSEYNGGEAQRVRYSFFKDKIEGNSLDSLQELELVKLSTENMKYPNLVLDKEKEFREKYSFILKEGGLIWI